MNPKIFLSTPHMGGHELKYIQEAFEQNWVAPLGPNVDTLEQEIENFLGENSYVAVLNSATSAIHLALIILGIRRGDEVICQSFTFSASANPIVYLGAMPIFVDSEPDTWNICPMQLEIAIKDRISKGKKPKAIIAVDLYGMPCQIDEIMDIANRYEIPVIEDSAEALGSSYKGQKCGTFGDISVLSFNGNKIITTSGGGALVCKTKEVKDKVVFLSTQARDEAPHYQHSEIGYNYRMSNICAGIGRGQMEVLYTRIDQRRANHQFYKEIFEDWAGVRLFTEPSSQYFSNHWLSAILIDEGKAKFDKENLRLELLRNNIECVPLWKPLHLQPVFANAPYYGANVAEKLFEEGLCLPSGSNLTNTERERIKNVIVSFKK